MEQNRDQEAQQEHRKADAQAEAPPAEAATLENETLENEEPVDPAAEQRVDGAPAEGERRREDEVAGLRAELESAQDRFLRQAAEFQNYRRRTEQEKAGLVEFGKRTVVGQLLDVWDDFSRSLEAAEEAEEGAPTEGAFEALKQGVDLVYRKFTQEMERLGVEPIEAEGQPFDENLHDAMMQQPAPEGTPPGVVLREVQRGYRMGDYVLRHSKVIVSA